MTSVGVKSVSVLFDASVSAKAGAQSVNSAESFDETLSGMRAEKNDEAKDLDGVEAKKSDDKTARFEATGRKNPVKPEEELTDEQIAAASEEVISQIKEMIMDKYNITEEQLTVTMESLGMSDEGFLNITELTKLVMKLEGIESQADMLTNPDFADNLKEILAKAEDIRNSVKPEDVEIKDIIDGEMEEAVTVEATDDLATDETTDDTSSDEVSEVEEKAGGETKVSEQVTASETSSDNNDNEADGLLKNDDNQKAVSETKSAGENNMVNPQDFARKLTEDLSQRVGETKANDIVRQVVEQTQLHVKQGVTSLTMQLYPEHLGKVLIQVVTHDGSITAQITAESEAAKSALESQLTLLKDNLNNQGIKVENVDVTIASHAFEQNMQGERQNEQGSAQSRKSRRSTDMLFDETGDEQIEENDKGIMELTGSTVSYSA